MQIFIYLFFALSSYNIGFKGKAQLIIDWLKKFFVHIWSIYKYFLKSLKKVHGVKTAGVAFLVHGAGLYSWFSIRLKKHVISV